MTVINTGLLTKDARSEFLNRFRPADDAAIYNKIATIIKSTKDSESYRWLGSTPRMREWGTGRKAVGLRKEAYDVANQKYESTLEVDRDELSDDQTGQIKIRIGEMALAAATHKDYLAAQLLINGATTGFNSYDGVTFFNTAHVSGASGNQSNNLTEAGTAAPTDPTTIEFKTALKKAVAAMMGFKDDRGEPMLGMNLAGLLVVVPTNMLYPASEAVNASIINNTTNVQAGIAQVQTLPWLAAQDTWYLCKTDGPHRTARTGSGRGCAAVPADGQTTQRHWRFDRRRRKAGQGQWAALCPGPVGDPAAATVSAVG